MFPWYATFSIVFTLHLHTNSSTLAQIVIASTEEPWLIARLSLCLDGRPRTMLVFSVQAALAAPSLRAQLAAKYVRPLTPI